LQTDTQTDRQTDRITDADDRCTDATTVGVSNNNNDNNNTTSWNCCTEQKYVVVCGGQCQVNLVVSGWKPSIPRRCWWNGVPRLRPRGEESSAATGSSTRRRRTAARRCWKRRRRRRLQRTCLTWPTRAHGKRQSPVSCQVRRTSSKWPQLAARVSASVVDRVASSPRDKVRIHSVLSCLSSPSII